MAIRSSSGRGSPGRTITALKKAAGRKGSMADEMSFRTSLSVKYLAAPLGLFRLFDVWVVCSFALKFRLLPPRIPSAVTITASSLL